MALEDFLYSNSEAREEYHEVLGSKETFQLIADWSERDEG